MIALSFALDDVFFPKLEDLKAIHRGLRILDDRNAALGPDRPLPSLVLPESRGKDEDKG